MQPGLVGVELVHERRPDAEIGSARKHELDGLLKRPAVFAHEEGRDDSACSVQPVNRMNQHRVPFGYGIIDEIEGLTGHLVRHVEDGLVQSAGSLPGVLGPSSNRSGIALRLAPSGSGSGGPRS